MMRHHVVVLGGSYGGIAAMRQLSKNPDIHVTLIDQHPYHYLQTEGYELISSNTSFDESIVSLPALCANYENVTFKHRTVLSINPKSKLILLTDGEETYDHLIIALGNVTKRFNCDESVSNYSSGAKSLRGAVRLNQFFEEELYKRLESSKHAKENFNIIIGGAGLSGVEIASSMQHFFNRYYRSNALSCATLHIHLIASKATVLYGMHPKVIEIATKRLKKLRVKVHTQVRVNTISHHEAILSDETKISFDYIIFAGGTKISPCLADFNVNKNQKNQIIVDGYLRIKAYHNIYAIGDCAALLDKHKKSLPPTAQTAIQSGEYAAINIIRTIQNRHLKKANISIKVIAIALGGNYAVIDFGKLCFWGYPAFLTKKLIEKLYKWPLWWLVSKGYRKIESCPI